MWCVVLAGRKEEIKQITQKRTEEKAKDKAQRRRALSPLGGVTPGEVWAWLMGLLH